MPNTLSVYDPLFYASEAILQLEKALGMANAVHRGFDKDPRERGSIISIRVPGSFTAQDAPSSAQDISAREVQINLDQWKEVKFGLTDKELTYTNERIINEHIRPAAYALADAIDQSVCGLYTDIPHYVDISSTAGVTDITAARKIMFDNGVPFNADPANIFWMIDSDMEADFLGQSAFSQWQGSGDVGQSTQITGNLGRRFGFGFFANQNVPSFTPGTASVTTLAVNGATAKGATSIGIDAVSVTGTMKKGDVFTIAGCLNPVSGAVQKFAVTETATASGNAFAAVSFTPPLPAAVSDGAVVTLVQDSHSASLAFHRNAFALAMAPLSTVGDGLGAKMSVISDPVTGISLRSRIFYEGNNSKVFVALDALWGVKTLDPNKALRGRN